MSKIAEITQASRKFQKELNSGTVSLLLLGLLASRSQPMYGYEIAKTLGTEAGGSLPMHQGALYPVLRSPEKSSLLTSSVKPSVSGPPRKYYVITRDGRQTLADWRETCSRTRDLVDSILDGTETKQKSK